MASVYVTEYADVRGFAAYEPRLSTQIVAVAATSTMGAAFAVDTRFVRVHSDVIASILFGTAPVATANSPRLSAGQTEYFFVQPGQKVAAITNT